MSKFNYIVYKVTNILNKKIYIGIHKQVGSEFDGYLGSGSAIINAVKHKGKENFVRETLYTFDTINEALKKEEEIVNKDFIKQRDNYNLCVGGLSYNITPEIRKRQNDTKIKKYGGIMGQCQTEEVKKKIFNKKTLLYGSPTAPLHTEEAFKKSQETFEERYGDFNSFMKRPEILAKRSDKLRQNYINKYPESINTFILRDKENKLLYKGNLFELQEYMTEKCGYIMQNRNIIASIENIKLFEKGYWKEHTIEYLGCSTTSSL